MLSIRTNIAALNSTSQLRKNQGSLSASIKKISSGLRINSAADDAAGLGVATRFETDKTSLSQAMRNTNDGISLVQTAEGSIEQLTGILIRMRELTVRAMAPTTSFPNGIIGDYSGGITVGTAFRSNFEMNVIYEEIMTLKQNYLDITNTSSFNEQKLLNTSTTISIQVGLDGSAQDRIDISLRDIATTIGSESMLFEDSGYRISLLGTLGTVVDFPTGTVIRYSLAGFFNQLDAGVFAGPGDLNILDNALSALSENRALLGSLQNRFENALSEASTLRTNISASQSQIMDVDYASESANMTRFQIQQQAGVAALAQAKAMPQSIISLLN
jgi:flagellin